MTHSVNQEKMRIAVLQRVCMSYRIPLFTQLASAPEAQVHLFIGEDMPNSKVRGVAAIEGVKYTKLKTRIVRLGRRVFPFHLGLVRELNYFQPDVILCEGESHFIGYLQAIYYKYRYNRRVGLIHWCFISLPGETIKERRPAALIKAFFRPFFDAFLLYSSYSKECLCKLGQPSSKGFVATNVGNVKRYIAMSDALPDSKVEAKRKLELPDRFTVLYVGTLDPNKRPQVMIELARKLNQERFNFVSLGAGTMLESLRDKSEELQLGNVFLPGRIENELPLYYRAADVLLIPGRGGIVISEAMAFGLPVIVHQADGTEYDLVQDRITGLHLANAGLDDFSQALEYLETNPRQCEEMGKKSRELVETRYTTANMVRQMLKACVFAKSTAASE